MVNALGQPEYIFLEGRKRFVPLVTVDLAKAPRPIKLLALESDFTPGYINSNLQARYFVVASTRDLWALAVAEIYSNPSPETAKSSTRMA
jgi:hypothetical protein